MYAAVAILVWWIVGGLSVLARPQWWEFLIRNVYGQKGSWSSFWLSSKGAALMKATGVASILAGTMSLILLYMR